MTATTAGKIGVIRSMMMTEAADTSIRRPNKYEIDLRLIWHGSFAGACIVAYLLGEVSTDLHRVCGYFAGALLAIRLLAAAFSRPKSVWGLPWPTAKQWEMFRRTFKTEPWRAISGRPPLVPLFGALVLIAGVPAILSGLAADEWHADDLHEVVVNVALWIVLGHVAVVIAAHVFRRRR